MRSQHYDGTEAEATITQEINAGPQEAFERAFDDLYNRCKHCCVELNADYVEAYRANNIFHVFSVFYRDSVLKFFDYTVYTVCPAASSYTTFRFGPSKVSVSFYTNNGFRYS